MSGIYIDRVLGPVLSKVHGFSLSVYDVMSAGVVAALSKQSQVHSDAFSDKKGGDGQAVAVAKRPPYSCDDQVIAPKRPPYSCDVNIDNAKVDDDCVPRFQQSTGAMVQRRRSDQDRPIKNTEINEHIIDKVQEEIEKC